MNVSHDEMVASVIAPAHSLDTGTFQVACRLLIDLAIDQEMMIVFLGMASGGRFAYCPGGCKQCMARTDAMVLLPDVAELEFAANGAPPITDAPRLTRADGRTVLAFRAGQPS